MSICTPLEGMLSLMLGAADHAVRGFGKISLKNERKIVKRIRIYSQNWLSSAFKAKECPRTDSKEVRTATYVLSTAAHGSAGHVPPYRCHGQPPLPEYLQNSFAARDRVSRRRASASSARRQNSVDQASRRSIATGVVRRGPRSVAMSIHFRCLSTADYQTVREMRSATPRHCHSYG